MYIITIDIGATFIKVATINNTSHEIIESYRSPFPSFKNSINPSEKVVDGEIIWEAACHCLNQLQHKSLASSIWISNQMHGVILVSPKPSAHLNLFYSWQDLRSELDFIEIKEKLTSEQWTAIGQELKPGYGAATLYTLKKQGCDLQGATPLTIGDYIAYRLTYEIPLIHATNASSLGVYNLKKHRLDIDIISALGLNDVAWPKTTALPSGVGLSNTYGVTVYSAIGDQQAALYGAGLCSQNELSINIATGAQCSILSSNFESGDFQLRPYFDGHYLKTITHIPAGRALNFLLKSLTGADSTKALEDLISATELESQQIPDTDLEVELSFFPGAFGQQGAISNITEKNLNPANALLASYKRMGAYHMAAAQRLTQLEKIDSILLSGGIATKSHLLQKIINSLFQKKIRAPSNLEDALIGLSKISQKLL